MDDRSVASHKFSVKSAKQPKIKTPRVQFFTTSSSAAAPTRHTARTGASRSSRAEHAQQLSELDDNARDGLDALYDEFMEDPGAGADSRSPAAEAAEHVSCSQAAGCSACAGD